jgi:EpsI family protein
MGRAVPNSARGPAETGGWPAGVMAHLRGFWPVWLAFSLTALAAAVGLRTGLSRLVDHWFMSYSHSWLILFMCLVLLWRALRTTTPDRLAPSPAGLVTACVVVLLYAIAEILDTSLAMFLLLPVVVLATIAALAGWQVARVAAPVLGLLVFTIPIWEYFSPVLQRIAVSVVKAVLAWTGPPIHVVGSAITIPAGTFEVQESCSGVRYLLVSLAIAWFYGLAWYSTWRSRLTILVVAALGAMVSNWIRIIALIQIGHVTHMQHDLITGSHANFGWYLYGVFLLPVLWLAGRLGRRDSAGSLSPTSSGRTSIAKSGHFIAAALILSTILAGPALLNGDSSEMPAQPTTHGSIGLAGWQAAAPGSWQPAFQSPSFLAFDGFAAPEGPQVDVYVAYYQRPAREARLLSRRNQLHPGWQVVRSGERLVASGETEWSVAVRELAMGNERRLAWYWYMVGGRQASGKLKAKLLEIPAYLRGRRDGAVFAASASCSPDCVAAEEVIENLLRDAMPRLREIGNGRVEVGGAAQR